MPQWTIFFHLIFTFFAVWKYNDQEFPSGSRFIPSIDFGKVTLDIRDTMAADSGVISCTAINARGQTAVTTGTLKVASKGIGVLSATQLPTGEQGLQNLQKFEASMHLMPCKNCSTKTLYANWLVLPFSISFTFTNKSKEIRLMK